MTSDVTVNDDHVRIRRIFRAPRELVYRAWTDPDLIAEWSGCAGATSVRSEMDFRVGGGYRHTLDVEGVGEMTMVGTYREIVEGRRIVYTLEWEPLPDMPGGIPASRVTVEFSDADDGTEVRLVHDGLVSEAMLREVPTGWTAAFDRLAERGFGRG